GSSDRGRSCKRTGRNSDNSDDRYAGYEVYHDSLRLRLYRMRLLRKCMSWKEGREGSRYGQHGSKCRRAGILRFRKRNSGKTRSSSKIQRKYCKGKPVQTAAA